MGVWKDGSIELTKEEAGRLRYELEHPNPEAMARRDAFFASFEDTIQISWEPFEMVQEAPLLSRSLLESLEQNEVECSVDLRVIPIVEYEMVGKAPNRRLSTAQGTKRKYQVSQDEAYSSVKGAGYIVEDNGYMPYRPERKINRCA